MDVRPVKKLYILTTEPSTTNTFAAESTAKDDGLHRPVMIIRLRLPLSDATIDILFEYGPTEAAK